ncbi:hypothetical protein [Limnofasciculus baicalensis]|uniref:Uncharacterized protein n=1 Tax=Limnofasciculus baicalensis BBK-W-15 TaxID=2699891 RepID=A0AAE3GWW9_9CYAN|nr:hypothetical protein [Limnofasciculus baicalensis]MCP2731979.1 hypothetical protein [Limnofasciculus baicalensis BBK-W-15]
MIRQSTIKSSRTLRKFTKEREQGMGKGKRLNLSSLGKFFVSQLATASLLALTIPITPAQADVTPFEICSAELLRVQLSREVAASACAEALSPDDLSLCVLKIKDLTPIPANNAVESCRRVRRPLELASCVVDISDRIKNAEGISVLDYCRRSLLPLRFSECVIGLSTEIDFSPPKALQTCIAAEDFSR